MGVNPGYEPINYTIIELIQCLWVNSPLGCSADYKLVTPFKIPNKLDTCKSNTRDQPSLVLLFIEKHSDCFFSSSTFFWCQKIYFHMIQDCVANKLVHWLFCFLQHPPPPQTFMLNPGIPTLEDLKKKKRKRKSPKTTSDGKCSCLQVCSAREHGKTCKALSNGAAGLLADLHKDTELRFHMVWHAAWVTGQKHASLMQHGGTRWLFSVVGAGQRQQDEVCVKEYM